MSVLQPLALLGLLTLPIIVILHLLRERSRRHVIPSLELWSWLKSEVRGPKPHQIPWNWILFFQLLGAILLTLALLRPQVRLPLPPSETQRLILVVDNSTSMGARDVRPTRLADAQARAGALLAALGGDDSAVLITAGPVAQRVADSADLGLPVVASALAALQPAGVGNDWTRALALASASTLPGVSNRTVAYTDGAFEAPEAGSVGAVPGRLEWALIGDPQGNQAIVTLSARPTASGALQVFTRVANFADEPAQRVVTLLADGETIDSSQTTFEPSGTVALAWTLPPGVATVEVRLSGNDALPADDRAALGVPSGQSVDALLVGEGAGDVERALRALPNLRLTTVAPSAYTGLEPHDLTIFDGWLPKDWPAGGVLVFDPPAGSQLLPVAGSVNVGEFSFAPSDPLFTDLSLHNVIFDQTALLQAPAWLVPVLTDVSGTGLVWRGASDASRIVVMSFVLGETNLTRRAAFPVLIANAVAELAPPPLPESLRPGESVALPSPQLFASLTVTDPEGNVRTFGVDREAVFADTVQTGLYVIEGQTPDGQPWRSGFGVNGGSPGESDLRLRAEPGGDGGSLIGIDVGSGPVPLADLWPIFVALMLVVVFVEARLAWR